MSKGYQTDFYTHSDRVRDPCSRQQKARKIVQALERYAPWPLAEATCLDIGCSSGLITAALASLFKRTIGVDYDQVALRATSPTARTKVAFVRSDALRLPVGAQSIDVIICAQVYEHVPDAGLLFWEINRVLRPGGFVFFSGPNWLFPVEPHYFLPFLHWLPERLADAYLRLTRRGHHYYEQLYPRWKLRELARHFTVQDITIEVFRQYHVPDNWGLRWIAGSIPDVAWRVLLPFVPNFNWLLYKPQR